MDKQYTSLSKLVNDKFTIKAVKGYSYKMWSNADKRYVSRDTYAEGFSKKYQVDTDKGLLDLGTGQLGNLLETVFKDGQADLNGKTFEVKSNGETGMSIRYFFSEVKDFEPEPSETKQEQDDDLSSIPF